MNKHISLVKKWLADNDSVTSEELKANSIAAVSRAHAAGAAANVADHAADAATTTDNAHYCATTDNAHYWVARYEELSNE